jgi:hypothetical protein
METQSLETGFKNVPMREYVSTFLYIANTGYECSYFVLPRLRNTRLRGDHVFKFFA